jgi:DUF4097 and DUF4098 domain-containing protein YvlB
MSPRTLAARSALALYFVAAPLGAQQLPLDREIRVSPGQTLELKLDTGGGVKVVGQDRQTVHVRAEQSGRPCRPECRVEVESTASGARVHSYFAERSGHNSGGLQVTVEVPRRMDLRVHTMGGGVRIENVSGDLRGETMGGELDFSRLGGTVHFSTMGGSVTVRDSNVGGSVSTMGGEVLLDGVTGGLSGSTMGGKVTRRGGAATGADGGPVKMHTMGGEITLDNAPAGAELETMGGDIHLRSAGGPVKAKTMGGTILLEAVDGSVRATTMGGDVRVRMVGDPARGDRSVEISSMGGDIELVVPAGLSMDVDAELTYTRGHEGRYHIRSDFPLRQTESPTWETGHGSPRKTIRATGSVNGGRNSVRIRTINGDVRIVKG